MPLKQRNQTKEWYYLTHSWEDTFPKGICPKVNVIAQLKVELAYYDSAVQRFNHYTSWTPPTSIMKRKNTHCSINKQYMEEV